MSTRFLCTGCGKDAVTQILVVCDECASKIKKQFTTINNIDYTAAFEVEIKQYFHEMNMMYHDSYPNELAARLNSVVNI